MSFTADNDRDNFETNQHGWELIREYIPRDKTIWAPFYCDGKQKQIFEDMGYDIIHEDEDFFKNNKGDLIIDNPPFSKFKEVCERLKELDKPFIIIGFSRVLLLKWFTRLFKEYLQVMIPFTRITFSEYGNDNNSKYTPPFGTMYFCYKMNLPKDLIFLE
jgi:hypothetical protein